MAWFDRSRGSGGGHPDEGEIHAWLDGALSAEDAARVESHVMGCAACREAVAEARGFIAASSRILTALDAVPSGVVPVGSRTRERPRARSIRSWPVTAAAAAIVIAVGVAVVARRAPVPEAVRAPAPIAPSSSPQAAAREGAPLAAPSPATPSPPAAQLQSAAPASPAAAQDRVAPSRAANAAPMAKLAPQGGAAGGAMKAARKEPFLAGRPAAAPLPSVAATASGAARLATVPCDTSVRKGKSDSSSALRLQADSMAAADSGRDTALRAWRGCRGLPKR
jgi:hypothetical protein